MSTRLVSRILALFGLLVLLFSAIGYSGSVQAAPAEDLSPELVQFTANGHVLGFGAGEVYVAGLTHALHIKFVGGRLANPLADSGRNSSGQVLPLETVRYSEVWPGVDVVYTSEAGAIFESSYIVHPGGRVGDIRLRYNVPVELESEGGLRLAFESGYMREMAPIAWQEINGERLSVEVSFRLLDSYDLGFTVGAYNPNYPLVVDPAYYWHTFYGSASQDYGYHIAVGASGNVYVVGRSGASWSGPNGESPLHAYQGDSDIAVVKLNSAGAYQWHTFYGSTLYDTANSVDIDGGGSIYITGTSEAGWNGSGGIGPKNPHVGGRDVAVIKLSGTGGYYWHTFYGSTGDDEGNAIAVDDADGKVFVTGISDGGWIGPYLPNPGEVAPKDIGRPEPIDPYAGGDDILVLALTANDATYLWHSFYGRAGNDAGRAVSVDESGERAKVIIVGDSPTTWDGPDSIAPLNGYTGGRDMVVVDLNEAGGYYWHTFYGGAANDFGYGVAVDEIGDIYLSGSSGASWAGPSLETALDPYAGGSDIVVLNLDRDGSYDWHTFHGSALNDNGFDIALDGGTGVYASGSSSGNWAVAGEPSPLDSFAGGNEIVALKLNTAGQYRWHAFYGSSSNDYGRSIAVDNGYNVYVAGYGNGSWKGAGGVLPLHRKSGSNDIVVVKTRRIINASFRSTGAYDGWLLESLEGSGVGGSKNSSAATLRLGDDAADRQYRAILHFSTSSLPDTASVVAAVLKVKQQGLIGTNPFTTHGHLKTDIRSGAFGASALLHSLDFQATSSKNGVGNFSSTSIGGWFSAKLVSGSFTYINRVNFTQFRLGFTLDDNDDGNADYLSFYSGNVTVVKERPLLVILYYVP